MIGFIKGKLASKSDNQVIIEASGIGYIINVTDNSPLLLEAEGEDVKVFTQLIVREDDMSLYGFYDKKAVSLFNKLMTVSGVGAKAALSILSAMQTDEVIKAITFGDSAMLTRANGVGKKGAERIILELGDKLSDFGLVTGDSSIPKPSSDAASSDDPRSEAIEALLSLGYSRSEAASAVLSVEKDGLSTEEYVKEALKLM